MGQGSFMSKKGTVTQQWCHCLPLAGGTLTVWVYWPEVLGILLLFYLQRSPRHQRRAKPLRGTNTAVRNTTEISSVYGILTNSALKLLWVCVKRAYCSAGWEHTVKHITAQSDTHHQIHSISAKHADHTFIHACSWFRKPWTPFGACNSSHGSFSVYRKTHPTPMRYRGFPRGRWSVLSDTIRQKSSFSSPPLKPPMAKPGTSRWVISAVQR